MLQAREHATVEEASANLLPFVLAPQNWVATDEDGEASSTRPMEYFRNVDSLRMRASVDVTPALGVMLHIAFRAPALTPLKAAEHLEEFLTARFPLVPNTEWQVEVDTRRWIHFRREYTREILRG
jgi:hypothetical protein